MKRSNVLFGAFALVLVACGGARSATTPVAAMSDDDQVFEVVVFHDLENASLASGEAVCVGTRGATSDGSALLAAIRSRYPTAVPDGACSGGGPDGPVVVTATHGKAVRIDIGPIEWGAEGAARIGSGGAYRGGGIREVEYTLAKHGSKWEITTTKLKSQT